MGVADGEDYPTVYKDAVIKIYMLAKILFKH